jgi:hypothetical protein
MISSHLKHFIIHFQHVIRGRAVRAITHFQTALGAVAHFNLLAAAVAQQTIKQHIFCIETNNEYLIISPEIQFRDFSSSRFCNFIVQMMLRVFNSFDEVI